MSLPIDLDFDPATVSLSPINPGVFLYCSDGPFIESLNRGIEGANPAFCFVLADGSSLGGLAGIWNFDCIRYVVRRHIK